MSDNLNVMTAADITALLSTSRERGGAERVLRNFVESEEMYLILNELPKYKGKSKDQMVSVKNQLTAKAKALDFTNVRLVKKDDTVIIVNTDLLTAEADESDEENDESV